MPTAEPFTALGRGNGFPFCSTRVDVDTYDYWTTLGGFNHNSGYASPSQQDIDNSLLNATKLYWNFYGATLTVSADSAVVNNIDVSADERAEPSLRVCGGLAPADKIDESGEAESGFDVYFASAQLNISIVIYYLSGAFIGYGLFSPFLQLGAQDLAGGDTAFVGLSGYSNNGSNTDFSLVTVSGIPFLCEASASGSNEDANAAALSASAGNTSAFITSLDFYTYP